MRRSTLRRTNAETGVSSSVRRRRRIWASSAWLGLAAVVAVGGCGPVWYLDPGFAERLAREQNKPMLIYFKAWDSSDHRNMKITVFEDPAVKRELLDTVNVELEFAYFPDIASRFRVQKPQICVMCSPIGQQVHTPMYAAPAPPPGEFYEWLVKAKSLALPTAAPATAPTTTAPARPEP